MFNQSKISTGLSGLVGIRQPLNPLYQFLDLPLKTSTSGLYLDDVEMFKIEFFKDTQDYIGATPLDLNNKLKEMQKSSIVSVCSEVFLEPDFIDRKPLYTRTSDRTKVNEFPVGDFVGISIKPTQDQNKGFTIHNVKLEFQGTGTVTLELYNSSVPSPLYTKDIPIDSEYVVSQLDWEIDSTMGDHKGEYFLGYVLPNGLKPFKRDYEDGNISNTYKNADVRGMRYPSFTEFRNLSLIVEEIEYLGINPDISFYDDYTDMIITNKRMFARAIQLRWAIMVMNGYCFSLQSNQTERKAKEAIVSTLQVIEGVKTETFYKKGLVTILTAEITRIHDEISKLRQSYFGKYDSVQVRTIS
jgi:hypothetical protein